MRMDDETFLGYVERIRDARSSTMLIVELKHAMESEAALNADYAGRLKVALEEIVARRGKALLGPQSDDNNFYAVGSNAAFDQCGEIAAAALSTAAAEYSARYLHYYRDILRRIGEGWSTPMSLARAAMNWQLHATGCATEREDECNCGAPEGAALAKNPNPSGQPCSRGLFPRSAGQDAGTVQGEPSGPVGLGPVVAPNERSAPVCADCGKVEGECPLFPFKAREESGEQREPPAQRTVKEAQIRCLCAAGHVYTVAPGDRWDCPQCGLKATPERNSAP